MHARAQLVPVRGSRSAPTIVRFRSVPASRLATIWMLPVTAPLSNRLLAALSRTAAAALPWEPITLAAGAIPRPISREFLYFPCSGLICLHCGEAGRVEVAVVGRGGSTGVALAQLDSSVVLEGDGWRVPRGALRGAARANEQVDELLAADSDSLLEQMMEHLAAANRASVIQRVAQWLLAAEAHSGIDSFRITHEMLAALLAVRRSGVTVALHHLEGSGAVRSRRNRVAIRDRSKLQAAAEAFGFVRKSAEQAIGTSGVADQPLAWRSTDRQEEARRAGE